MTRHGWIVRSAATSLVAALAWGAITPRAEAGKWFQRRQARPVVVAPRPAPAPGPASTAYAVPRAEPAPLGSFYHNPTIMVGGNWPNRVAEDTYGVYGGYSPNGFYGDTTMVLYGPLSALRAVTAPVPVYSRGYDGRTIVTEGTATSYPNMPELSPVIYPTKATNFWGFRETTTLPWWTRGTNWIDQN